MVSSTSFFIRGYEDCISRIIHCTYHITLYTFEFCGCYFYSMEFDLCEAMKRTAETPFPQTDLKHMLYQILSAVSHIHEKWYLHRDLKTSNILVHKSGRLCVCDFGLARKYQNPLKALTQLVITLWYRPPELLFGETVYGPEVDIWSIGCIFAELITKKALLQGSGELDQIDKVILLS